MVIPLGLDNQSLKNKAEDQAASRSEEIMLVIQGIGDASMARANSEIFSQLW
ncbi:hypothetical protein CIPAW_01G110900 [Carya illinoinensis]|uniref:Uncharacterized protein n=1 Tax=Carya illinoinensis TaxID=32201 RepID=A0A8T1RLD9_CARIL|nr:hypothetical protein CIPAW_01G110900 [Carya illinoinensis]